MSSKEEKDTQYKSGKHCDHTATAHPTKLYSFSYSLSTLCKEEIMSWFNIIALIEKLLFH